MKEKPLGLVPEQRRQTPRMMAMRAGTADSQARTRMRRGMGIRFRLVRRPSQERNSASVAPRESARTSRDGAQTNSLGRELDHE